MRLTHFRALFFSPAGRWRSYEEASWLRNCFLFFFFKPLQLEETVFAVKLAVPELTSKTGAGNSNRADNRPRREDSNLQHPLYEKGALCVELRRVTAEVPHKGSC